MQNASDSQVRVAEHALNVVQRPAGFELAASGLVTQVMETQVNRP